MGRIKKIILVKGRCFNYLCEIREKCIEYSGDVDKDNDIVYPNMVYALDSCDLFESGGPPQDAECQGSGHYMCSECRHLSRNSNLREEPYSRTLRRINAPWGF